MAGRQLFKLHSRTANRKCPDLHGFSKQDKTGKTSIYICVRNPVGKRRTGRDSTFKLFFFLTVEIIKLDKTMFQQVYFFSSSERRNFTETWEHQTTTLLCVCVCVCVCVCACVSLWVSVCVRVYVLDLLKTFYCFPFSVCVCVCIWTCVCAKYFPILYSNGVTKVFKW